MISRHCQLVSYSTLQVFELTSQLTENTWPATINDTVIITKGALQTRKECIQLIKKVDESRLLYCCVDYWCSHVTVCTQIFSLGL